MLPFTRDQFLAVFAAYNHGVWPAQVAAYLVGAVVAALLAKPSPSLGRFVGPGLAAMWLWTGIAYHWLFFAAINRAALAFGALFILQGTLLLGAALARGGLRFTRSRGAAAWLGRALIAYAAFLYPLVGTWAGHAYPQLPCSASRPAR